MKHFVSHLSVPLLIAAGAALVWWLGIVASTAAPELFPRSGRVIFTAVVLAGAVALLLLGLRYPARRTPAWAGLGRGLRSFGVGALCFLIPAALVVGGAVLTGSLSVAFTVPTGEASLVLLAAAALVFLSEALPEELIFRGAIQSRLTEGFGVWTAIIVQAVFFLVLAWSVGGVGDLQQASFLLCFGLALGMLRAATGSLWTPVGFHLAMFTAQQWLGPSWGVAVATPSFMLQIVAFGMIPMTAAIVWASTRMPKHQPSGA